VDVRGAGFNLLGDHFQPIVAVLAPFFRVFPSASTLLIAQALLLAASVFPISQLAGEKLGRGHGRAIAIAYGFSWGLQQLAQFDFHEIAFAVPLLAFSLSALARGHTRAAVCWALPLVFVKEDQGYTVAAIGIYLIVAGLRAKVPDRGARGDPEGRGRMAAGQLLLVWGFAWSFVAIGVIIPHFNPAHVYQYWTDGGALGPGEHPSVVALARQVLHAWPDKLQTVVMLLLPTAFIALRSPLVLIAVPSVLLRFVSTDSSFWSTYWHYNATLMPIMFVAAIDALARIGTAMDADVAGSGPAGWASGRRGPWRAAQAGARRYGAAMMVAITVPLAFQFPLNQVWNASTYQISPHVAQAEAAMAQVPDGATVLTTLDLLAPLAARTDTYWLGNSGNPQTQYIVFDGADSDYSPAPTNVPAFIASLYPPGAYTEIFADGDVYVFRHASLPIRLDPPDEPEHAGARGWAARRGHRDAGVGGEEHVQAGHGEDHVERDEDAEDGPALIDLERLVAADAPRVEGARDDAVSAIEQERPAPLGKGAQPVEERGGRPSGPELVNLLDVELGGRAVDEVIGRGGRFPESGPAEVPGETAALHGVEVVARGGCLQLPPRVEHAGFVELETGREIRLREQRGQQLCPGDLDRRPGGVRGRGDRGAARADDHRGGGACGRGDQAD
jgi:uncharacterized membrane protein